MVQTQMDIVIAFAAVVQFGAITITLIVILLHERHPFAEKLKED